MASLPGERETTDSDRNEITGIIIYLKNSWFLIG